MSHWHKVIIALLCAGALFYFDSKEVRNVRNNDKFSSHSDIRVRLGNISLRSVCFMATKRKRTRVKCPVCEKWVRTLETRDRSDKSTYRRYECANLHRFVTKEKVERVLVISHSKRKKA
jgi:hypothetical protein